MAHTTTSPYPAKPSNEPMERVYAIRKEERENWWFLGDLIQPIVTSEMSHGKFMLTQTHAKPGSKPPLHEHADEDEILYILEGEVTFWIAGREMVLGAGDCMFMPRDVPHIFQASTEVETRWLNLSAPGGLENFFREVAVPADYPAPQRDFVVDSDTEERLLSAAKKHGITMLEADPATT
ncbi:cupin domain-containing protein [Corynebacterium sp. YIM 101645]|uniref:Cupin domain-containing protein n=1 Tax=Corynebacterium lemuris TaxID=1859292 RepID=A0ABT2FSQ1_9CORY|nr:cupin domain-containing protein [Corynebacterium lemuris]MCS5478245.1 cupin domain-containing protein [Corynebacterium lemuris]